MIEAVLTMGKCIATDLLILSNAEQMTGEVCEFCERGRLSNQVTQVKAVPKAVQRMQWNKHS